MAGEGTVEKTDLPPSYTIQDEKKADYPKLELHIHNKTDKMSHTEKETTSFSSTTKSDQFKEDTSRSRRKIFGFPPQCFILLIVEICERFCFYGVRSILAVYLTKELGCTQTEGTSYYHYYIMMCYLTPILGGLISDQYWGKFKTICNLSIVYVIGNAVVSYGSYTFGDDEATKAKAFWITAIGLLLISMGTGGIKPCVSSICGDQFDAQTEKKERDRFFDVFYLCINLGSMFSSFLTPKLRALKGTGSENPGGILMFCENASGNDDDRCYSVAFGLPSILMVFALIFFWIGSPWYIKKPPGGSVVKDFSKSASYRLYSKVVPTVNAKSKWTTRPTQERFDTKRIFAMLAWILPIAGFWSIFDLAGSRLTYICKQIDSTIYSPILRKCLFCQESNWIKEDQVEAINPLLIFFLTPFLTEYIYPCIEAIFRINYTRLGKMLTGMFGLVLVCIYIYVLQQKIDENFTYIFPEDNPGSTMRNASLIYQLNYHEDSWRHSVFNEDKVRDHVHSQEIHWNFKNYDNPSTGNHEVMPSNVFTNSGVTSKRVWAKDSRSYFSRAITGTLSDSLEGRQLLEIDDSTPFINFSLYAATINQLANAPAVGKNVTFVDHEADITPGSTLDKVYLEMARMNKFILFNNKELHRIFQDEERVEDSGQNRVDIFSLNENYISPNTNSTWTNSGPADGGYTFICKNDYLSLDYADFWLQELTEMYDPFQIHQMDSNGEYSKTNPIQTDSMWRYPIFKKHQIKPISEGSQLHQWSFIIPQYSNCYFTNKWSITEDDRLCVRSSLEDCETINFPGPQTVGTKAIYSIIDYGDGGVNSQATPLMTARLDTDFVYPKLNVDFSNIYVSLSYMVTLYIILTIVEILISISGLAYSYQEAPESMKAFVSSLWLIPVALGNVIVVLLNHIEMFQTSVLSYFLFNVFFAMFLFFLYIYVVINYETMDEYQARKQEESHNQHSNINMRTICNTAKLN